MKKICFIICILLLSFVMFSHNILAEKTSRETITENTRIEEIYQDEILIEKIIEIYDRDYNEENRVIQRKEHIYYETNIDKMESVRIKRLIYDYDNKENEIKYQLIEYENTINNYKTFHRIEIKKNKKIIELKKSYYKKDIRFKYYYYNYNNDGKLKSKKNDIAYKIINTYNKEGIILKKYYRYDTLGKVNFKKINKYKNAININTKSYYYKNGKISYGTEVQRNNSGELRSNKYGKSYLKNHVYLKGKKVAEKKRYYNSKSKLGKYSYYLYTKKDDKVYRTKFILVNKHNKLSKNYAPGKNKNAKIAYSKMRKAAKKDGVYLNTISWYRSYNTQKYLFNHYLKYDSYNSVSTYCAKPGYSEHQLGMAIDVGGSSSNLQGSFGNTKEGKWIKKNAHKYGFVVRYLKGKQKVTGYIYEPWHIRYVGGKFNAAKAHATSIKKSKLAIEEYLKTK